MRASNILLHLLEPTLAGMYSPAEAVVDHVAASGPVSFDSIDAFVRDQATPPT